MITPARKWMYIIAHAQYADGKPDTKQQNLTIALYAAHIMEIITMANEMMDFPQTVEEFMEQYKIVDSKEIYSNGMEMVPIFRMKQWFEHQMSVEQYRQRMIEAFHNADCDELIALVALPTEKEFKHLEWLLKTHYKEKKDG